MFVYRATSHALRPFWDAWLFDLYFFAQGLKVSGRMDRRATERSRYHDLEASVIDPEGILSCYAWLMRTISHIKIMDAMKQKVLFWKQYDLYHLCLSCGYTSTSVVDHASPSISTRTVMRVILWITRHITCFAGNADMPARQGMFAALLSDCLRQTSTGRS